MVCNKCQKKLDTLITPDKWKEGSSNAKTGSAGRKLNENKLLSKKNAFNPLAGENKCKMCKKPLSNIKHKYCQHCAYKKGLCQMCGVQIQDVSMFKQSTY
ncbi:PDZ-binding protein [Gorgonomyces haynaldii]|nr:PDZ-binding protein [Gorgonomyces haynaldii]